MTFFNRIPLSHHFFIEQFDYYTAFFGKLGKEIILFYLIMQFVYNFTSLATHSTWLDCSRLMSDFSVRSREFIKAYFCLKTHRFLPLYVLGNRSKTLLLLIISKHTDLPTASRLRSDGTSLKPHRLNIRILIHQVFLQIRILPFLLQ